MSCGRRSRRDRWRDRLCARFGSCTVAPVRVALRCSASVPGGRACHRSHLNLGRWAAVRRWPGATRPCARAPLRDDHAGHGRARAGGAFRTAWRRLVERLVRSSANPDVELLPGSARLAAPIVLDAGEPVGSDTRAHLLTTLSVYHFSASGKRCHRNYRRSMLAPSRGHEGRRNQSRKGGGGQP